MAHIRRRQLKSGKYVYDVRTRIDGRPVMLTKPSKHEARAYAATVEADKLKGIAIDPRRGRVTLEAYANQWLADRTDLAQRTAELYKGVLDRHVLPTLGKVEIGALAPSAVRSWNSKLTRKYPPTAAKAYRILSTIMATAVRDELVARNPCVVKGASSEKSPERPVASVAEVEALAMAMPDHLRVVIDLASWCQLRRGEILGLRRRDIDLENGTITISLTRGLGYKGTTIVKEPKTEAGRRTIAVPGNVIGRLRRHLDTYVAQEGDAPVAVGAKGGQLRPNVLQGQWNIARKKVGRPDLRLHDLRHSGLTWAAATGATTAELMHRGGHKSNVAALRYQHATADRDRALAVALAEMSTLAPVIPLAMRDGCAMDPVELVEGEEAEASITPLTSHDTEQSQRGSNPCPHLERVVS